METFAIGRPARRRCDGVSRRHLLRLGSAGLWGGLSGLALPGLLRAQEVRGPGSPQPRAKNVIFIFLEGGPPQQDMWDPKPGAPAEIRGPFKPIQTSVPGTIFTEHCAR